MGRPLRRPETGLPQGGPVLLLPRLVGRRPGGSAVHQPESLRQPVGGQQGHRRSRRRHGPWRHAGQVRRAEPLGPQTAAGRPSQGAAVLAGRARRLVQSLEGSVRIKRLQKRVVEEDLRRHAHLLARPDPVVPCRRRALRQLHGGAEDLVSRHEGLGAVRRWPGRQWRRHPSRPSRRRLSVCARFGMGCAWFSKPGPVFPATGFWFSSAACSSLPQAARPQASARTARMLALRGAWQAVVFNSFIWLLLCRVGSPGSSARPPGRAARKCLEDGAAKFPGLPANQGRHGDARQSAMNLSSLTRWLPFLAWPRPDRQLLKGGFWAGMTGGLLLVPPGVAYAALAGMPLVTGIYSSLVSALVAVRFSSSARLGVGPTALTSLLIGAALTGLAEPGSAQWVALAAWMALLSGLLQLVMGLARFGWLLNLITSPVLSGFTQAAALLILGSQLRSLTGLRATDWGALWSTPSPDMFDLTAAAFGMDSMALLLLGRRRLQDV